MRVEKEGIRANRISDNHWAKKELDALAETLETGATQLEMAAALPQRSWEAIRKKLLHMHYSAGDGLS